MSEAPKTLALDSNEWKALLQNNLVRAHEFVTGAGGLTPAGVTVFCEHLDRMKGIAAAWQASSPPVTEGQPEQTAQNVANGAAPAVKGKGGWPKGKKRNAPNQQVAQ